VRTGQLSRRVVLQAHLLYFSEIHAYQMQHKCAFACCTRMFHGHTSMVRRYRLCAAGWHRWVMPSASCRNCRSASAPSSSPPLWPDAAWCCSATGTRAAGKRLMLIPAGSHEGRCMHGRSHKLARREQGSGLQGASDAHAGALGEAGRRRGHGASAASLACHCDEGVAAGPHALQLGSGC